MSIPDTVTFGIPLIGRQVATNWARVVHQLNATIGSIYNQTDPNFRIIVAGTDRPEISFPRDARYEFLEVDQLPPMNDGVFIGDAVRKRYRVAQRLRQLGGGYLMLTDSDDLISRDLVAFVRGDRHANGYLVARGYMFDAAAGVLAPFPFEDGTSVRFDQECGTSAVLALSADELPMHGRDRDCRYSRLMAEGHPAVIARATEEGRPLADLPFRAVVYVRNTGENVSARSAVSATLERIAFQARLDDDLRRTSLDRTDALDAEFNLKAAETALRAAGSVRPAAALGLSVLIATHRRPAGLQRLLTALRPSVGRGDRQVIVVNDGSHDDSYASVIAEFQDVIRYVQLPEPQGIVGARNAALALAAGTYSVFTDDDCEPPSWWLDWLTATLLLHPEIDAVAGDVQPLWTTRSFRERVQAAWFLPRPWYAAGRPLLVTANAAIRTSLLRAVGGFGFAGFAGAGEDTELSIRLHRAGARFLVDPSWTVTHEVGAPFQVTRRRYRRYGEANRRLSSMIEIAPPRELDPHAQGMPSSMWSLVRSYAADRQRFEGTRIEHIAAAVVAATIQTSYLRGLGVPRR